MSVRNHSTYCPSGLKVEVTDQDPLNSLIGNIACTLSLLLQHFTLTFPWVLLVCMCLCPKCSLGMKPVMYTWVPMKHHFILTN